MAWVERLVTRTTQPQDAAGINWAHPSINGLVSLMLATPDGMVSLYGKPAANTSGYTKSVTRGGIGSRNGVTNGSVYSDVTQTTETSSSNTVLWAGVVHRTITGGPIYRSSNTQVFASANSNAVWQARFATTSTVSSTAPIKIDTPSCFVHSQRGSVGAFFLDGQLAISSSATPGSSFVGFWRLGANISFAQSIDQTAFVWAIWDRGLSEFEAKSLSDNPWQIFEPEVIRIWVDDTVSAGGVATVIPIGVQATGSVGTPSATGAARATPAGVSASSAVGTPVAVGGASIPATVLPAGVQATSAIGTVSATGAAVAQPVGVVASSAVGTPVAIAGTSIPATVLPAGVQASSAVGTPTAKGAAIAQPLGVAATAYVGTPTIATGVSGVAVAYPAGVQAIGQVGTLIATGAAWTAAVGVQAVASVGTPAAYAGEIVIYVAGAQTRPSRLQSSSRPSRLQTGTRASR